MTDRPVADREPLSDPAETMAEAIRDLHRWEFHGDWSGFNAILARIDAALTTHSDIVRAAVATLDAARAHPDEGRAIGHWDDTWNDAVGVIRTWHDCRAALAQPAVPVAGAETFDDAWTDLLREFPTRRDATVRAILEKHRAALRAAQPEDDGL